MKTFLNNQFVTWGVVVLISGLVAYGGYEYYRLSNTLQSTQAELASTTKAYSNATKTIAQLEGLNEQFRDQLEAAREENNAFEEQIEELAEAVGTLEKIQKTDKELLKKYSRVYFLNENYVPSDFEEIDERYVYGDESEHIHADVWSYLEDLLEEAEDDNIDLRVISGYRSFGEQADLKAHYTVTYGSGANQFSADQGYSEHQLGTTVDFTTEELGTNFTEIDTTEAYEWLQENAHTFGFILSYPENNSFYEFEPWHWRFVGVDLATDLHRNEMHFYDMEQREIDRYLPKLFE